ncbi:MAG: hypothetical protein ABI927_01350, partial [Gaiellaceae bacterium]
VRRGVPGLPHRGVKGAVPRFIDDATVVLFADLENATPSGKTRHVAHAAEVGDIAALVIVQYEQEDTVYLLYYDDEWRAVTDTQHDNVERAVAQAEFEFEPVEFRSFET